MQITTVYDAQYSQTKSIDAVKAKVEKAQAQLAEQLEALQTSDDWKRTLERMAILGPTTISRFSFRNILLLLAQCPDIHHAATFNGWQKKGRNVKKGAIGLTVLRPRIVKVDSAEDAEPNSAARLVGFNAMTVFSFEQTEGDALPEAILPQHIETPEGFGWTVEGLREVTQALPGVEGITLRHRGPGDHPSAGGWFDLRTHQVVVIQDGPPAQQLKTLLHEVAHAILHGDGEHHATPTAEVEAESTAFVVAHALGLDTSAYSLPYVATWALAGKQKEPSKAVAVAGERVRKASALILGTLFPSPKDDVG